ncbi:MAG: sodium:calcium symporter, partial [Thermotogae bacterium]|nr:sodium:calcium symporter [Thermotogota bacterium]
MAKRPRQHWGSRIGAVLATAGNAVGLGNLLRFPSKVALYGGGAFIIPYLISLALLGLPLMWIEWMAGRYGGARGHGSTVGIIGTLFKSYRARVIGRLIGVIGVAAPVLIIMYYIYIESWTLGFSLSALFGWLPKPIPTADTAEALRPFGAFLQEYTRPTLFAYIVFWITVILNWYVLQRGVRYGIEVLAKYGMPLLIVMAIFLAIVIFFSKGPNEHWSALKGLEFIWKPDFSKILNGRVWVEAAGQIFFTLSLGMGAIATYASYVKEKDDVVVTGMATASTNEFVEVVLGSSIAIPAA